MAGIEELIEAIGEAPFAPDTWPRVMAEIAQVSGGWSGQLLTISGAQLPLHVGGGISPDLAAEFEARGGADPARSPRARAILATPAMRSITDDEFIDARGRQRAPLYREFLEKVDGHHVLMAVLGSSEGARTLLAVNRSRGQGAPSASEREVFDDLLPHVARAVRLQEALQAEGAKVATNALAAAGLQAIVCTGDGRVRGLTPSAEALLRNGALLGLRGNRIVPPWPRAQAVLDAALRLVCYTAQASTRIRLPGDRSGAELEISSLPSSAGGFRLGARALIIIVAGSPGADDPHAFEALSAAEQDVALALAQGVRPLQIAADRGVSIYTVRAQIRSIYTKLNVDSALRLTHALQANGWRPRAT